MATSRYAFTNRVNYDRIATSSLSSRIYFAALRNQIGFNVVKLVEGQRLDHVAAKSYGDATLWWIIASASGIGWALQCPAGTTLRIPTDLNQVFSLLRE
jgi:hypothetical protein